MPAFDARIETYFSSKYNFGGRIFLKINFQLSGGAVHCGEVSLMFMK
jgi:hypothetical protein